MLQIVAACMFFVIAGGALALISAMLSAESEVIVGALRRSAGRVPSRHWVTRVRPVSMPAPVAAFRAPQRACA